jgi:hypothetical protein
MMSSSSEEVYFDSEHGGDMILRNVGRLTSQKVLGTFQNHRSEILIHIDSPLQSYLIPLSDI